MSICAIIYGVVEKIVDIVYWTMATLLIIFEMGVLGVLACICFVPLSFIAVVFAAIFTVFYPVGSCISSFLSRFRRSWRVCA